MRVETISQVLPCNVCPALPCATRPRVRVLLVPQLTPAMAADPRLVFSLLIGTNDLRKGGTPTEVAGNVYAIADYILGRAAGRLLVNAILPHSLPTHRAAASSPETELRLEPTVLPTNALLVGHVDELRRRFGMRVGYVDCGASFVNSSCGLLRLDRMPDGCHPNAAGYEALGSCLVPALEHLRLA